MSSWGPTPPGADSPSSTRSRTRRNVTQNACVACLKKRTKCDGKIPCSKCIDHNIKCDYEAKATISKDELRADLRVMKSERASSRIVLQALLLDKYEAVVTRLRLGESIDSIAQSLGDVEVKNEEETQELSPIEEGPRLGNYKLPPNTDNDPEAGRAFVGVTEQFRAGQVAPVHIAQDRDGKASTKWLSTPMDTPDPTVPPGYTRPTVQRRHSFDDNVKLKRLKVSASNMWTKVTPNRDVVNHLIGLLFTWEFPLFTMVSQELFLRDYYHGSREFCSPALVNAISSLATRYMQPDQAFSPPDVNLLGDTFFREAMGLLVHESRVSNLPSVQAFGLLAVRELSCGRELEAQELCLQAIRLLSSLDLEDLGGHGQYTDHLTVRSITYSGVLTLIRAIRLITDQLSPSSNYHYSRMPLVSEPSAPQRESVVDELEKRMSQLRNNGSQQPHLAASQALSNFVFEQTEYVYTFLARTRKLGKTKTKEQLPPVFQKCLLSYDAVMVFLKGEIETSPITIFAHTYFQFCLLALCRSFVEYELDVGGVSPRTICVEAVQTVLDLTESYAKLFTLRQTPCFIPYFVFAAGLTRITFGVDTRTLSLGATSPGMGSSPETNTSSRELFFRSDVADETGDIYMSGTDNGESSQPASGPMTNDSNVYSSGPEDDGGLTQAVSQLDAMSSGHPAASQAGWVLRDFKPDHAYLR